MSETKHTPGKWQRDGMTVYALNEGGVNRFSMLVQGGFATWEARRYYGDRTEMAELEENAILASAAPDMLAAVRANYAWTYAERLGLGSFDQRSALCAHAEYLTAKAFALATGRTVDDEYKGYKKMTVWPDVGLEESTHADGEALCALVFEHEAQAEGTAP